MSKSWRAAVPYPITMLGELKTDRGGFDLDRVLEKCSPNTEQEKSELPDHQLSETCQPLFRDCDIITLKCGWDWAFSLGVVMKERGSLRVKGLGHASEGRRRRTDWDV